MTSLDLTDRLPIHLFERALDGQQVRVQLEDGSETPLAADVWRAPRLGDDSVIARCGDATLDVGCGSGRMTEALTAAGIPALGIDISPRAVLLTQRRGVKALHQDVFAGTPGLGSWQHVLLMDGNIGIAGNAALLLARCRDLLRPGGTVIVEAEPPGTGIRQLLLRLVHANRTSHPFNWLISDARGVKAVGAEIGLVCTDEWSDGDRFFIELTRP